MVEPLLVSVPEAARILSLGRSKTYLLVSRGVLPSLRIGRSVLVPLEELRAWVAQRRAEGIGEATAAPGKL